MSKDNERQTIEQYQAMAERSSRHGKEYSEPNAPEIHNGIFGIDFDPRGKDDDHVCIVLYAADDGHYWETQSFSHYWLDAVIKMLEQAREELKNKKRFRFVREKVRVNGYRHMVEHYKFK